MIVHRFPTGGGISVVGACVQVTVPGGPGGLPLTLSFEGKAVAALLSAAVRAYGEREAEPLTPKQTAASMAATERARAQRERAARWRKRDEAARKGTVADG